MAGASGREARQRAFDLLHAMTGGEECAWTVDRLHEFPDGDALQLEFEPIEGVWPSGAGRTRAVLFDAEGRRVDESEWYNDPQVRWMGAIPRLRALVDARLASASDSS
jgi:hypothetical protein